IAGAGHPKHRTRFWIELAKAQRIPRERPRQDGEIPLHIAGGDPGRLAGELIGSDRKARLATGLRDSRCRTTHAQDRHGRSFSARLFTPAYFISIRRRENPSMASPPGSHSKTIHARATTTLVVDAKSFSYSQILRDEVYGGCPRAAAWPRYSPLARTT